MSEDAVAGHLVGLLKGCRTWLDLGCGTGKYQRRIAAACPSVHRSALDAHWDSLAACPADIRICAQLPDALQVLRAPYADAVTALDVIEHLSLEDGRRTLDLMRAGARRVAAVFLPVGEHPQAGAPGTPWQAHRTTWTPEMLSAAGYIVGLWRDFHAASHSMSPDAMWGVWWH